MARRNLFGGFADPGSTSSALQGMDSVDWSSLDHAYGSAIDVPELLIARASRDPRAVKAADYEFFGNIHHQGQIYSATPLASRFLVRMLVADTTLDRDILAGLLGGIVRGYERPKGAGLHRRAVILEVSAHTDALWSLLDADIGLRRTMPYLLAGLPSVHHDVCARLPEIVCSTEDTETAASSAAALVDIAGSHEAVRAPLWTLLESPIRVVRGLAAVGILRCSKAEHRPDAELLARPLHEALLAPEDIDGFVGWPWDPLDWVLGDALESGDRDFARALVEALIPGLPMLNENTGPLVAHAALPLFFDSDALSRAPVVSSNERALLTALTRDTKVPYSDACTQGVLAAFGVEEISELKRILEDT